MNLLDIIHDNIHLEPEVIMDIISVRMCGEEGHWSDQIWDMIVFEQYVLRQEYLAWQRGALVA